MSRRHVRLIAEVDELVAAHHNLAATASEQTERLRANVLEFRVLELKRQLILGRIRRTLERAGSQCAAPPSAERRDATDLLAAAPVSTAIH
jgi:hypothetical protein